MTVCTDEFCGKEVKEVCARDGDRRTTFKNECFLAFAQCKFGRYKKLNDGPCRPGDNCNPKEACKKTNCRFGATCIVKDLRCIPVCGKIIPRFYIQIYKVVKYIYCMYL
jgi:hypothetical protein